MRSFSDHSGKSYSCVVLDGRDSYPAWSFTVKEHLTTAGLIEHVVGEPSLPAMGEYPKASEDIKIRHLQREQEAKSILLSTMKENKIVKIVHCKSAHEMWAHFERAYGLKTANAKLELMSDLNNFKCSSAAEVTLTTNKILAIKGKLVEHDVVLDDMMVIASIIRSLPPSFSAFLDHWHMIDVTDQSLDKFVTKLLERAKVIEEREKLRKMLL